MVCADAGYQGIDILTEMEGWGIGFRVGMRPGKRRGLTDTREGRVDDLIETAKAHIRATVEHPTHFRVIKRQFGFQKTPSAGNAQELLQSAYVGSTIESVHYALLCST